MPKRVFSFRSAIPSSWLNLIENHTHSDPTAEGAGGDIKPIVPANNLADNADFQIWTRGDSVTVANNASQICSDRHGIANFNDAGATATMSKDTMLVDGVPRTCGRVFMSGPVSSFSAGKYIVPFMHFFEGRSVYRYLSPGKSFVVAAKVEVNVAGKYAFAVRNADYSFSYVHTAILSSVDTPTTVQFTVPIPTTSGVWNCPNTIAKGLELFIGAIGNSQFATTNTDMWVSGNYLTTVDCVNWAATAGATIKVTQVRLEEGAVLGAYQAKTWDEDKARCAYFYREMTISIKQCAAAANAVLSCPITWADMRVAPTWVLGDDLVTANVASFTVASQSTSSGYVVLQAAAVGDSYTTRVIKSSGAEL